ncbi:LexA family protein [Desulfotalea psychrophila]|uniref:Related to repressor protein n=1 Tax=Desulfotalea psychrophila (strain LSv54 / DSM 12343) TaxID=177439 RepID=Q6ALL6_DESPS|nr:S24 family peptidase [Desulfotalea psychrophila]CAG36759.1 related to repressor protein [Desulfotalea psychrophila LSv54]
MLKQTTFSAALVYCLSKKGYGASSLCAKSTGISSGYLTELKKAKKKGSEEQRRLLALYFEMSYEDFLAAGEQILAGKNPTELISTKILKKRVKNLGITHKSIKKIPLLSWTEAAEWSTTLKNTLSATINEWITVICKAGKTAFALKVMCQSMEPEFCPGDIIIVDPEIAPETGRFVIAQLDGQSSGSEATLKRFERDGGDLYLVSLNDKYGDKNVTDTNFKICGCVVQKIKNYSIG